MDERRIENDLRLALQCDEQVELPTAIANAVRQRRWRRRQRMVGAGTFVCVVAIGARLFVLMPMSRQTAQQVGGQAATREIEFGGGCEPTVIGLMACNHRFANLDESDLVLNEDWDLSWMAKTPVLGR